MSDFKKDGVLLVSLSRLLFFVDFTLQGIPQPSLIMILDIDDWQTKRLFCEH